MNMAKLPTRNEWTENCKEQGSIPVKTLKKKKTDFQENIKKFKIYYERHKDEPEFREAQRLRSKKHSEKNKEYYQNYRYEKKVKDVVQSLERLGFEWIVEILIPNKKV